MHLPALVPSFTHYPKHGFSLYTFWTMQKTLCYMNLKGLQVAEWLFINLEILRILWQVLGSVKVAIFPVVFHDHTCICWCIVSITPALPIVSMFKVFVTVILLPHHMLYTCFLYGTSPYSQVPLLLLPSLTDVAYQCVLYMLAICLPLFTFF